MGRRGRTSGVARNLRVIEGGVEFNPQHRLEPPEDMSAPQKEVWREVVKTEPVEFFSTAVQQTMLRTYCQLMVSLAGVQKAVDEFDMRWIKSQDGGRKYRQLQAARTQDLSDLLKIARGLRLTSQSRYTPAAAATHSKHALRDDKFPWEL